jgi:hypothetical protein
MRKKTAPATKQDRPDILKRREEWFDGQLDLDPEQLIVIDNDLGIVDAAHCAEASNFCMVFSFGSLALRQHSDYRRGGVHLPLHPGRTSVVRSRPAQPVHVPAIRNALADSDLLGDRRRLSAGAKACVWPASVAAVDGG